MVMEGDGVRYFTRTSTKPDADTLDQSGQKQVVEKFMQLFDS